ncbi:hypothetical protein AC249_AIPGENE1360 [Exaiptasia diaphana]|nr:hypothetical protein AC249_AIPGENE1360 [Exaiptasia diaphana]
MPNQAKKVTSTSTTDKQTKTKKKKKSSSSHKIRRESGSDSNEGVKKKSKSRRGRISSDSAGSTSQECSPALSGSSSSNDRTTSSSSGENISVLYQSENSDLDCAKERLNGEESKTNTTNSLTTRNESLRWDNVRNNEDDEEERLRVYKINRRKRYMEDSFKYILKNLFAISSGVLSAAVGTMVNDKSHHSELSLPMLNENSSGSVKYDEVSGFYERQTRGNMKDSHTSKYSDGLYLYLREPSRLYSYRYTSHEKLRQKFITELNMYPTNLTRKYVSAINWYPIHNNGYQQHPPSYKQFLYIVPKKYQRFTSTRILKEKQKKERHWCGLKFQPKQETRVYSSTIYLLPN